MPGLLRGIARTAVVAGTASAVNGRVQRRQAKKFAGSDAQIHADRQQAYQQEMADRGPGPRPDLAQQLRQLADLRDQGILTDAEFQTQKARLLA